MNPRTTSGPRRKRLMTAGIVAATLTVAGGGAAMAANAAQATPASPAAQEASAPPAPAEAAPVTTTEAPPLPATEEPTADDDRRREVPALDPVTQARYDAVWAAGYTTDDIAALAELWQLGGDTDVKARIGQALLDGETLPVQPGTSAPGAQYDAFWEAGYEWADVEALMALWGTPWDETKLRAGQMLLDGQPLPLPGTPAATPAR